MGWFNGGHMKPLVILFTAQKTLVGSINCFLVYRLEVVDESSVNMIKVEASNYFGRFSRQRLRGPGPWRRGMNPTGPRLMVAWNKMDSVPGACWQVIWHEWRWAINLQLASMTLPRTAVAARGRQVSWCSDLYGSPDSPPAVCLKLPRRLEETHITSRLAGIMKLWLGDSELWQAAVDSKSSSHIQTTRCRFSFNGPLFSWISLTI